MVLQNVLQQNSNPDFTDGLQQIQNPKYSEVVAILVPKLCKGIKKNDILTQLEEPCGCAVLTASNWFTLAVNKGQWEEFIWSEDIHIASSADPPSLPPAPPTQELRRSSRIAARPAPPTLPRRPPS